jgi:NAD(P)-dependent dehydrogenase (short-subunit alcohol dehydrogenase family)
VNNAHDTTSMMAMFLDVGEEQLLKQLSSGLFATIHFMQACYPYLKQNRGKVINFASGAGQRGAIAFTAYAAAKEAIRGISRVAAREWGPDKINVNVLSPTSMTEGLTESAKDPTVQAALSNVPLGMPGQPIDEVAPVALFLATDASAYITGHTINVDGGNLMDAGR